MLGMLTTTSLVVYPSIFGVIGKLLGFVQRKYNKPNLADTETSRG